MHSPSPEPRNNQLSELYEAIEVTYAARKRFLVQDDLAAARVAERMMNQLLAELYTRLGAQPAAKGPSSRAQRLR